MSSLNSMSPPASSTNRASGFIRQRAEQSFDTQWVKGKDEGGHQDRRPYHEGVGWKLFLMTTVMQTQCRPENVTIKTVNSAILILTVVEHKRPIYVSPPSRRDIDNVAAAENITELLRVQALDLDHLVVCCDRL